MPRRNIKWGVQRTRHLDRGLNFKTPDAALRQLKPARVIVAVPVGAPETCTEFRAYPVDVVIISQGNRDAWPVDVTDARSEARIGRLGVRSAGVNSPLTIR